MTHFDESQSQWIQAYRASHPSPVSPGTLLAELRIAGLAPPGGLPGLKRALAAVNWFDGWVQEPTDDSRRVQTDGNATTSASGDADSSSPDLGVPFRQPAEPAESSHDLRSLMAEDAERIIETCRAAGTAGPLVELWLAARSPYDKSALRALEGVSDTDLLAAAVEVLHDLLTTEAPRGDPALALKRLGRHYKSACPPELRSLVTSRLQASLQVAPEWLLDGVALAVAPPVSDAAATLSTLEAGFVGGLLEAALPWAMKPDSPRDRLYRAAAASEHWALLGRKDLWAGIDLSTVGEFTRPTSSDRDLLGLLSEDVVRPTITKRTRSMRLAEIFELVGRHPHLAPFIDPKVVTAAAERSDAGAALFTAATASIRAEAERLVAAAEQSAESARVDAAATEVERAREVDRAASLQSEVEQLQRRLERLAASQTDAHQAELRQAQVDVLKALVSMVEEVRNVAALDGHHAEVLRQLFDDGVRTLNSFGVHVVGTAGSRRPPDAALDGPSSPGTDEVEVVSPAYVLQLAAGDVTPLRHAVTRPVIT